MAFLNENSDTRAELTGAEDLVEQIHGTKKGTSGILRKKGWGRVLQIVLLCALLSVLMSIGLSCYVPLYELFKHNKKFEAIHANSIARAITILILIVHMVIERLDNKDRQMAHLTTWIGAFAGFL